MPFLHLISEKGCIGFTFPMFIKKEFDIVYWYKLKHKSPSSGN